MILNGSGWNWPDDALRASFRGGQFPFRILSQPIVLHLTREQILGLTAGSALPGDGEGAASSLCGSSKLVSNFTPADSVSIEKIFGERGAMFLGQHPEALNLWRFLSRADLSQTRPTHSPLEQTLIEDTPALLWNAQVRALGALWTFTFLPGGRATFVLELAEKEILAPALSIVTEAAMEASAGEPLRLVMASDARDVRPGMVRYQSSSVPVLPVLESILSRIHREGPPDLSFRTDDFRFHLPRVALTHQDNERTLDIFVSYRYDQTARAGIYPDFLDLKHDVIEALCSYPNRDDYWELVNHALVRLLLKRHASLASVAITLEVHPDSSIPYFRASTVAASRQHLPPHHDETLN